MAAWAFASSTVIPGPSEGLLVLLGLADPRRAFSLAVWSAVGSVLGALAAYGVGLLAFAGIGRPLLLVSGFGAAEFDRVRALFAERGWQVVAVGSLGFLPVPLTSLAAGGFGFPLVTFALIVLAGRSAKFLVVAIIIRFAGSRLTGWVEKRVRRPMDQVR